MDPLERQMLRETLELARENNEYLKKMRRTMFLGSVFKVFYWVIIIGFAVGAFYFLKPYMDLAREVGADIGGSVENVKTFIDGLSPNN